MEIYNQQNLNDYISNLDTNYVYYLCFLLNPYTRHYSTIIEKSDTYNYFKNIFSNFPEKLKHDQQFIIHIFDNKKTKESKIKQLLIEHFNTELINFFIELFYRNIEIGDLFLHDNYWLDSKDCRGNGCKYHAIDDINDGEYFYELIKECKND